MGSARNARTRRLLWPALGLSWLGLAGATLFDADGQAHAPSAETHERDKPPGLETPTEGERLAPPRGIRPPWREPLIPEQRRLPEKKRRPMPA